MEYKVLVKTPSVKNGIGSHLSGGFGMAAPLELERMSYWRHRLTQPSPDPFASATGSFSFDPSVRLSTFSMRPQLVYENNYYALYFKSYEGGFTTDYFDIDGRTLVYNRAQQIGQWAPDPTPAAVAVAPEPGTSGLDLTVAQLKAIAPQVSSKAINRHLEGFNKAMRHYGMNTRLRQAHFIAQCLHESGGLNYTTELGPDAYFNKYNGRRDLGNTHPGDGPRFRGRGLIQITGRNNYTRYGQYVGKDFTQEPNNLLLAQEPYAADAAGWFWAVKPDKPVKDLNTLADRDNIRRITRIVNGGYRGLDDRIAYLNRAKRVFGLK